MGEAWAMCLIFRWGRSEGKKPGSCFTGLHCFRITPSYVCPHPSSQSGSSFGWHGAFTFLGYRFSGKAGKMTKESPRLIGNSTPGNSPHLEGTVPPPNHYSPSQEDFLWPQVPPAAVAVTPCVPLEAHYSYDICPLAIHCTFYGESQPVYQLLGACFVGWKAISFSPLVAGS